MKHTKTEFKQQPRDEYTAGMRALDIIMGTMALFIFAGILLALYVIA